MKIAPEVLARWEQFKSEKQDGLMETLSISVTEVGSGSVKASMPVGDATRQPFGFLHGGASVALAETTASLGSWMLIEPESQKAVGLEINANHLRAVADGKVHAEAAILHQGKRMHVWQIMIHDDRQRPVCVSRCTVAIIDR
ncbi:PaaI family thioesterase [Balneolales bacterium ANBcel1]|nr:PaaI family thioesterase [Balneolales bacterium ANBcel1]